MRNNSINGNPKGVAGLDKPGGVQGVSEVPPLGGSSAYQDFVKRHGPEYFREKGKEFYWKNREEKLARQREYQRAAAAKKFGSKEVYLPTNECIVVFDPDEVGGFAPGNKLNCVAETLKAGSFTPGTIIKYKETQYKVSGVINQKLERIGGE